MKRDKYIYTVRLEDYTNSMITKTVDTSTWIFTSRQDAFNFGRNLADDARKKAKNASVLVSYTSEKTNRFGWLTRAGSKVSSSRGW